MQKWHAAESVRKLNVWDGSRQVQGFSPKAQAARLQLECFSSKASAVQGWCNRWDRHTLDRQDKDRED
jgi:hypothetical protein